MASKLLNRGELINYKAVGVDGVIVWQKADAFINSIKNSSELGPKIAEYLAVPSFTQDASKVDWYIPFASKNGDGQYDVVTWQAASFDEKRKALSELKVFNQKLLDYGLNLEARSITSNDKLYAHFLIGADGNKNLPAIEYPNENCLFIVDGRPVITFWGFYGEDGKTYRTPFTRAQNSLIAAEAAPVPAVPVATTAAATAAAATAGAATAGVVATESFWCRHKWCFLLGLPLLLLLLALLLYLLWWWLFARNLPLFKVYPDLANLDFNKGVVTESPIPNVTATDLALPNLETTIPLVDTDGHVVYPNALLEESDAPIEDAVVPAEDANTPIVDPNDEANTPIDEPKDDGKLPNVDDLNSLDKSKDGPALSNEDLNSNDISKLNGVWKVNSNIVDRDTNKPLQLQYDFKDGEGTATITTKSGVKCRGPVKGGLSGGALSIDSESEAECTDGSVYNMPSVKCKPGENGNSNCVSTYKSSKSNNGKEYEFMMNLHR